MIKFFKKLFKRKPKAIMLNNEFKIVKAFKYKGETYFMFENALDTATGRGLTAMVFMEELLMNCNSEYLENHVKAVEQVLSSKQINIFKLSRLNENLKERLNFLMVLPEQLFKFASVVFFTKDESPYRYDEVNNKKKIEEWSKDESMYDFFLQQTQLRDMIPVLSLPPETSAKYLEVEKKINKMHMQQMNEIISKGKLMPKNMN